MKFAMLCLTCRSWYTNIHFDPTFGYTLRCIECGTEEPIIVTPIAEKPLSKKDIKKASKIEQSMREHFKNISNRNKKIKN